MKVILQDSGEPEHEGLIIIFNLVVAAMLRDEFIEDGIEAEKAWDMATSAAFTIAMIFDQTTLEINGQTFRPRVAFANSDEELLPGAAVFDYVHEYVSHSQEDLEGITFYDDIREELEQPFPDGH